MPRVRLVGTLKASALACIALATCYHAAMAQTSRIVLRDGRVLEGKHATIASLDPKPAKPGATPGAPDVRSIVLIDNGLARYFVSKRQIVAFNQEANVEPVEHFNVRQTVAHRGGRIARLSPIVKIDPFDEDGRRIVTLNTNQGLVSIVQGITEVWPAWTKVESVQFTSGKNYIWDMRLATHSIPPDMLRKILHKQIDPQNVDDRLKLARLFLQSERYQDALDELELIRRDFPKHEAQFESTVRELKQASARRALREIDVRRRAGQHRLAFQLLDRFPAEGVAGETLKAVQQRIDEYRADFDKGAEIQQQFDALIAPLDGAVKQRLKPIRNEIFHELNLHSLDRMSTFWQFRQDPGLGAEEKVALVVSGWLIGGNDALRELPVALSLYDTRNLIAAYLAEPGKRERSEILRRLTEQEAATPALAAKLLKYLLPPLKTDDPPRETPGFYELEVASAAAETPLKYIVQTPPEYDPHRLYPAIVTLHGANTTPQMQIDWWAGARTPNGDRRGQATRYSYVVIAPAWSEQGQIAYQYSATEHAAVLVTLRDACRRFSIDPDRIFLTGHSMGGDAAWDIGLAHPDLWAGMIPIVARADRCVRWIWENARGVPFYLVQGQLDGDMSVHNAVDLDRYLTHGYNATIAEFQGRGHENFSDEIQNLFDWMNRYRRDFFPQEIECLSARPGDNYFWWVELDDFPLKAVINPAFAPPANFRAARTEASLNANNGMSITTAAGKTTIWLSPEIVNFNQKVNISVNGRRAPLGGRGLEPSLPVLLEDARGRADRQHPFWAKLEMPAGKLNQVD